MKSGIYLLRNASTRDTYVGSSVDCPARGRNHLYMIAKRQHRNPAIRALSLEKATRTFTFEVLEHCECHDLIDCEKHWIKKLNPTLNVHREKLGKAKPVGYQPRSVPLNTLIKPEMAERVHTYQSNRQLPDRADAVRELLDIALVSKGLKP